MTLHLVRARIDRGRLAAFAARMDLLDDDLGYALHLALRRRFGAAAPQPFRLLDPDRAEPRLLGYAADPAGLLLPPPIPDPDGDRSAEALAEIFRTPFEAKAMPDAWPRGLRLRFEARLRPVRRHGSQVRAGRRAAGLAATGAEHDAFLSAVERLARGSHDRTRESAYREWLAERLSGAACLHAARLAAFRRTRVLRSLKGGGGRGRRGRGVEGPEAIMAGTIEILDSAAFVRLLARGVGRHAAFGYGMLLLRPGAG